MDLSDGVGARRAVGGRVNDENVGDLLQDGGPQRVPSSGRDEGMLRPENNFEMRVELAGEICDDVHVRPDRMS